MSVLKIHLSGPQLDQKLLLLLQAHLSLRLLSEIWHFMSQVPVFITVQSVFLMKIGSDKVIQTCGISKNFQVQVIDSPQLWTAVCSLCDVRHKWTNKLLRHPIAFRLALVYTHKCSFGGILWRGATKEQNWRQQMLSSYSFNFPSWAENCLTWAPPLHAHIQPSTSPCTHPHTQKRRKRCDFKSALLYSLEQKVKVWAEVISAQGYHPAIHTRSNTESHTMPHWNINTDVFPHSSTNGRKFFI